MVAPKFVTNQVVLAPTSSLANSTKAVVVAGGTAGVGVNIYLVAYRAPMSTIVIQQLVTETIIGPAV